MGEGIETWPHAAGWPVRKVVSCSIKREEQDGASQTTVPTGMGRAGSWLPGPFLTFHGLRGHWRCWFWVWFSKGWVEGKYLFSPTFKGFIKMCKCRVERGFKDETEGRGSGLEKSLLCGRRDGSCEEATFPTLHTFKIGYASIPHLERQGDDRIMC